MHSIKLEKKKRPLIGGIILDGHHRSAAGGKIVLGDGREMIEHVIDTLLKICNKVIIAGSVLPPHLPEKDRVIFVPNNYKEDSQLAGIEAILASGLSNDYLIAASNQPFLEEDLLRELISSTNNMPCFFEVPGFTRIQPLPGYFPVSWLPEIRDALGNQHHSFNELIAESDVILRRMIPERAIYIKNINSAYELKELSGLTG